jgi:hypothetical protein
LPCSDRWPFRIEKLAVTRPKRDPYRHRSRFDTSCRSVETLERILRSDRQKK